MDSQTKPLQAAIAQARADLNRAKEILAGKQSLCVADPTTARRKAVTKAEIAERAARKALADLLAEAAPAPATAAPARPRSLIQSDRPDNDALSAANSIYLEASQRQYRAAWAAEKDPTPENLAAVVQAEEAKEWAWQGIEKARANVARQHAGETMATEVDETLDALTAIRAAARQVSNKAWLVDDMPVPVLRDIARDLCKGQDRPTPGINALAVIAAVGMVGQWGFMGISALPTNPGVDQLTNLGNYIFGIAPTGIGKNKATMTLKATAARWCYWLTDLTSVAALVGNLAPDPVLSKDGAKTPVPMHERRAVALVVDEVWTLMAAANDNAPSPLIKELIAKLMELSTVTTGQGGGKKYADKRRNIPVADNPSVCLFGLSTPDRFLTSLDSAFLADGFIGRTTILLEEPPPAPQLATPAPEADDAFERRMELGVTDSATLQIHPDLEHVLTVIASAGYLPTERRNGPGNLLTDPTTGKLWRRVIMAPSVRHLAVAAQADLLASYDPESPEQKVCQRSAERMMNLALCLALGDFAARVGARVPRLDAAKSRGDTVAFHRAVRAAFEAEPVRVQPAHMAYAARLVAVAAREALTAYANRRGREGSRALRDVNALVEVTIRAAFVRTGAPGWKEGLGREDVSRLLPYESGFVGVAHLRRVLRGKLEARMLDEVLTGMEQAGILGPEQEDAAGHAGKQGKAPLCRRLRAAF